MCTGRLYVIGIPIGNKDDITPRALNTLARVDVILAEDTRRATKVLHEYGIAYRKILSFHEHKEKETIPYAITMLKEGKTIALISDAGMPCVSDPGYLLVRECVENNIAVSVVPGVSASITALVGSGIAPIPYTFLGFLPRGNSEQQQLFSTYKQSTLIFFERKNRVVSSLHNAFSVLGNRKICIARELTKVHEEYIRTSIVDFLQSKTALLGEVTVVIEKAIEAVQTPIAVVLEKLHALPKEYTLRKKIHILQQSVQGYTAKQLYAIVQQGDKE